jgi:hypothetical protein
MLHCTTQDGRPTTSEGQSESAVCNLGRENKVLLMLNAALSLLHLTKRLFHYFQVFLYKYELSDFIGTLILTILSTEQCSTHIKQM